MSFLSPKDKDSMTKDDGVIENYSLKPYVCFMEGQREENKISCKVLLPYSAVKSHI